MNSKQKDLALTKSSLQLFCINYESFIYERFCYCVAEYREYLNWAKILCLNIFV